MASTPTEFPNAFFVQPTQGASLISNVPHNLTEAGPNAVVMIRHALDNGLREIEGDRKAGRLGEPAVDQQRGTNDGGADCTPGYYNNEGQDAGLAAGSASDIRPAPRPISVHRRMAPLEAASTGLAFPLRPRMAFLQHSIQETRTTYGLQFQVMLLSAQRGRTRQKPPQEEPRLTGLNVMTSRITRRGVIVRSIAAGAV